MSQRHGIPPDERGELGFQYWPLSRAAKGVGAVQNYEWQTRFSCRFHC